MDMVSCGLFLMPTINDPADRLEKLIKAGEHKLSLVFLSIVQVMRERLDVEEIINLLLTNQWSAALTLIMEEIERLGAAANAIFVGAGQDAESFLRSAGVFGIAFDGVNDRAVLAMKLHRLSLIQNFTDVQREATRIALLDGLRQGYNPVTTARVFRDSIGLTPYQQNAVSNYRRLLERGNSEALSRKLRDRRFDSTVRRAVLGERALTVGQVNKMVSRYSARYVKYRSQVIARTQSLRAVHEGNRELYRQAIDVGKVKTVNRTWHTGQDGRQRQTHDGLNGVVVRFEEPWVTFEGNRLMYPGDPSAPAEEVVQCRCVISSEAIF